MGEGASTHSTAKYRSFRTDTCGTVEDLASFLHSAELKNSQIPGILLVDQRLAVGYHAIRVRIGPVLLGACPAAQGLLVALAPFDATLLVGELRDRGQYNVEDGVSAATLVNLFRLFPLACNLSHYMERVVCSRDALGHRD